MTREGVTSEAGREPTGAMALVCPRCGATSPAGARLCRRCFANLEGAISVETASAPDRRRPALRQPSTTRGWVLLVFAALVLLFVVWQLKGWIEGPPAPLPAVSGQRAVVAAGEAWALPGGGLDGARRIDAPLALEPAAGWHWAASSAPTTSMVTDGGSVYVGLEEGVVVSVGVTDGVERWRARVPGVLESAPAIAGDRLYVGYRSGGVAALDVADGTTIWESQIGVSISTSPIVVDGIVFVAGNGVIGGFDAEDGAEIWRRNVDESFVPATPVADGEVLVVGTFERVLIFDRSNGELLTWATFAPQYAPVASVAVDDGLILATSDGQLMAIETTMRRPWWDGVRPAWEFMHVLGAAPDVPWRPDRWSAGIPSDAFAAAVGVDLVVVAAPDGTTRALSRADGTTRWEATPGAVRAAPVITSDGVLVVGADQGWLLALEDGAVLREFALPTDPIGIVAVESGAFVLTDAGIDVVTSDAIR